jgi:PAS domain S-box-containing protein
MNNRIYAFVNQVNKIAFDEKDETILLHNTCRAAVEFGQFKMACISLVNNESKKIKCIYQYGVPGENTKSFRDFLYKYITIQERILKTGNYYISSGFSNHTEQANRKPVDANVPCIILPIKRKAGDVIGTFNLYDCQPICFDGQKLMLILDAITNISAALEQIENTEKNILTKQLARNEKRFRTLVEKSTDMLMLSTIGGKILYGSPAITQILGYSLEEIKNKPATEYIHPDAIATFIDDRMKIAKDPKRSTYFQHQLKHKDGHWIWCEGTGVNMLHDPDINAIVSSFRDITERKLEEQRREFDEKNLNALINSSPDLIWSVDKELKLLTCNDSFKNTFKQVIGHEIKNGDKILPGFHIGHQNSYKEFYELALTGKTFKQIIQDKNSWTEVYFYPICLESTVIGTACHSRDITKIKQSEKDLIESEKRYRQIVETSQEGIWVLDENNKTTFVNEKTCEILEYSRAEMIGRTHLSFKDEKSIQSALESIERRKMGIRETMETKFVTKSGRTIWVQLSANPIFNDKGDYQGGLAMMTDITERKVAEIERIKIVNDLQLRNAELEQFSYIVSHNLRAPVANIMGASNMLKDPELAEEDIEILNSSINKSIMKLDDVIKDLNLILQTKSEFNTTKEIIRFSDIIEDIKISLKNVIQLIDININYDFSELDYFMTLKPFLYSIFFNLISNSIKYRKPEIQCVIDIKSQPVNNGIEIIFTDNGIGMNLQKRSNQIFGLYQRFHTHIEGKGMGLFMVKTQTEALGGRITLESEENIGTTFKIEFPI